MVSPWSPPYHWLHVAYFSPTSHFRLISSAWRSDQRSNSWSCCSSLGCVNFEGFDSFLKIIFVIMIVIFLCVSPSCNIMLWYSVLYRAVVAGRAGVIPGRCPLWGTTLPQTPYNTAGKLSWRKQRDTHVISRAHLKLHTLILNSNYIFPQ